MELIERLMIKKIFVYGTLQFPEILKRLTGKTFSLKPAILNNFQRCCIKDCDYPALIQSSGAKTEGFILEDMDDISLKAIDIFEGDEYEKKEVTVNVDCEKVEAIVYVWNAERDKLLGRDWDAALFEKTFLHKYLD